MVTRLSTSTSALRHLGTKIIMHALLDFSASWALRFILWAWLFTSSTHASMLAVVVLVFCDFVSGIWAALKRGERISSWGIRRTITTKIMPYQFAILCSHLVEQQFMLGSIPLMKATAGFIAVAELKSVFENLGQITGLDFWHALREKLQPIIKPNPKE
jgi:Mg2+/Co2+ transporter CorB